MSVGAKSLPLTFPPGGIHPAIPKPLTTYLRSLAFHAKLLWYIQHADILPLN